MFQVPPFQHRDEQWTAENDGMTSRAQMARASGPYRSTVPPRIATWTPDIPRDLAADIGEAAAALSRFDHYARRVLGETSPSLGPMTTILLRPASASSSQIAHLPAGAHDLASHAR